MKTEPDAVETTYCGYVALVGRPNVGKSTLLNHLLRQKISITSRKPQTTRHRILGVTSEKNYQTIYIDTPGLHERNKKALNKLMNETVASVVKEVDVVLLLVEALAFNEGDRRVLELLQDSRTPVFLIISKVDTLRDKTQLLPHIDKLAALREFAEIVPLSAQSGHNVETLEQLVRNYLPEGAFLFPADQVTDRSSRFLASELIREKVTRQLGDELPYEITVEIEQFKQEGEVLHIHGLILVDKSSQKRILVGAQGDRLKQIGSQARLDMEAAFNSKVMLNLWVKVRSGWADDERALQSLGYMD